MQYRPARIYPFDSLRFEQDDLLAAGKITPEQYQQNVALIPQKALAISKWYVYYFYMHPFSGKYERFKVYEDINLFRGDEKIQYAKDLRDATTIALKNGYSPWDEEEKLDVFLEQSELHAAALSAGDYSKSTMTYALHRFLKKKETDKKSKSTISAYKTTANFIRDWLNDNGMLLVPASEIPGQKYLDILEAEASKANWEAKTYNNYLLFTQTILNWLANKKNGVGQFIPENPIQGTEGRTVITRLHEPYTDKQLEAILKAVRSRKDTFMEGIILTCYYAAVRSKEELRNFTIGNIHFDRDLIRLDGEGTKANADQLIPLDPNLKEFFLKQGFDKLPGDWYVFGNKRTPGAVMAAQNFYGTLFRDYRESEELQELLLTPEHTLYGFKHTRAIHLANAKVSPYAIMQLFRHSSLEQTMIYLRKLGCVINREATEHSREL